MSEPTEEEKFYVQYIIQQRIYDLLAIIARAANKEEAEQILQMHEQGVIIAADPSLSVPGPPLGDRTAEETIRDDKLSTVLTNIHDREEIHRAVVEAEQKSAKAFYNKPTTQAANDENERAVEADLDKGYQELAEQFKLEQVVGKHGKVDEVYINEKYAELKGPYLDDDGEIVHQEKDKDTE